MSAGRSDADALLAIAATLDSLAEVWLVPGADVHVRAGELTERVRSTDPALARVAASLLELSAPPATPLDIEFARLFLAARTPIAYPYESYYRGGLLADPACLAELRELYGIAGVMPDGAGVAPDHLGAELDLLALALAGLAGSSAGDEADGALVALAAELIEEHLRPFLEAFAQRLVGAAPAPYYAAATRAAVAAVAAAPAARAGPRAAGAGAMTEPAFGPQ